MMKEDQFLLRPVGTVRSPLKSREDCPRQGWEGAPEAWLEIDAVFADALDGLSPGQEIFVLTWLHQGRREVLRVHPRGDPQQPLRGVFATRSPDRPNPIGVHRVAVVAIEPAGRLRVRPLEAVDGTPILDIKPVITGPKAR
jgi:tRNA-Thr(GGU) m(6)t(6)A37 methyltransferase TsaA